MKNILIIFSTTFLFFNGFSQTTGNRIDTNNVNLGLIDPVYPEFPGGIDSLTSFFSKNLRWPATDICISGKVVVQFQVDTLGMISNIVVIRSLSPLFDKEAIRVVSLMPNWKPVAKPTTVTLPVSFQYQDYHPQR